MASVVVCWWPLNYISFVYAFPLDSCKLHLNVPILYPWGSGPHTLFLSSIMYFIKKYESLPDRYVNPSSRITIQCTKRIREPLSPAKWKDHWSVLDTIDAAKLKNKKWNNRA